MTSDQRIEFLNRIREMVSEHCTGYIFIAEVEADEFQHGMHEGVMISDWGGGITITTGLMHRAMKRMEREDAGNERRQSGED